MEPAGLPTRTELASIAVELLPQTGILRSRGMPVVVGRRLYPAFGNPDEEHARWLRYFPEGDRSFVRQQIQQSHRRSFRPTMRAPWTITDEELQRCFQSVGEESPPRYFIALEVPLISRRGHRVLLRMQRGEPRGCVDFAFVLERSRGRWSVAARPSRRRG